MNRVKAFIHSRLPLLVLLTITLAVSSWRPGWAAPAPVVDGHDASILPIALSESAAYGREEPYYMQRLHEWQQDGIGPGAATVEQAGGDYILHSERASLTAGHYEGMDNAAIWTASGSQWLEYAFEVPADGLYEIHMDYYPLRERNARRPITLNVQINGSHPFMESRSLQLSRRWADEQALRYDDYGDQIRPMAEEIPGWLSTPLRDSGGAYALPLVWHLPQGELRIRLGTSDPLAIGAIRLQSPQEMDNYAAYAQQHADAAAGSLEEPLVIEAEQMQWKSDSAVALGYDNDIASSPAHQGNIVYNVINGKNWRSDNQEAAWVVNVPESGYYNIGMRTRQGYLSNKSTFRAVAINGEVPFTEMLAYRFPYASAWQRTVLADETGQPYRYYLEAGDNLLSLRVTHAPFKATIVNLEQAVIQLRELAHELKALTGGSQDPNRTWNLSRDLPGFLERLQDVVPYLDQGRQDLERINGRPDGISQGVLLAIKDLESMLARPNEIPYEEARLVGMQGTLASFMVSLSEQPLQVDRLYIVADGEEMPDMTASFLRKMQGSVMNFMYSFRSKEKLSELDEEVLNVWMMYGRDYVNLLQNKADQMFTAQTGIRVKVNLLPDTNLLVLMNAAGIAPDVVLGLPQQAPFDFALRSGAYDLSTFSDFAAVREQFAEGIWMPFQYDGGYYGMPETQNFQMMFYRKDILDKLGLEVPDTWEDVYDLLPVLQQNNYNFMPLSHMPFFFQKGADYLSAEEMKTALQREEAFEAFKEWTDLTNIYAVDHQVTSFYQHFRNGSIPIGIADFSMYVQLMVAAPELNGWWGIAPIPGVRDESGEVVRWMGGQMMSSALANGDILAGSLKSSMIFSDTDKAEESWQFLKWWMSTETQESYGQDLELLNGRMFRWNTANIEAFVSLPWKEEDLAQILEQWRWFREIPNMPGSYFLERELLNAWNRTVVDDMNYRLSLEMAIMDIDREIRRKMQEFDFIDVEGQALKELQLPRVTEPWKGVEPYLHE